MEGGQVVGLVGPNGAGKTTLLRMLATLPAPTDGEVRIAGQDLRTEFLDVRQRVGFMPDFFNLYSDLTLYETLRFFADAYGVQPDTIPERVRQTLLKVDLHEKADEMVRNLSRGMTQRLGLATLLVRDPECGYGGKRAGFWRVVERLQLSAVERDIVAHQGPPEVVPPGSFL